MRELHIHLVMAGLVIARAAPLHLTADMFDLVLRLLARTDPSFVHIIRVAAVPGSEG